MESHWLARDEARLAEQCMNAAESRFEEKNYLEARSELKLALHHLMNAERMAVKEKKRLPGIHRARYNGLLLKLRWCDHILNWLGL